jgi:hypothetical protein
MSEGKKRDLVSRSVVDGRLEGLVDGRAIGWAWSPQSPLERIWVAVLIDGEPVGSAMADMAREDLLAAGIGDGAHGFAIRIPIPLPENCEIRVLVGGSSTPLPLAATFTSNSESLRFGHASPIRVAQQEVPISKADRPRLSDSSALSRPWSGISSESVVALFDRWAALVKESIEGVPAWVRWTALAIILLAITWPFGSAVPRAGLDRSWQIGLALAFSNGLVFGRDIIFTYGPLGFTVHPLRTSAGVYRAALIIGALVQTGLLVTLLLCMRRTIGLALAVLATFLLASLLGEVQADPLLAIAFGAVALTLTANSNRAEQAEWRLAIGGGALAAVALLVKLDDGTASTVVIGIGLAGTANPRRALAQGAISFTVALIATWLLVGQPLGGLPDYFKGVYQVVSGYVDAMGKNEAGSKSTLMLLLLLGSAITLSVGAWVSMIGRGDRQRRLLLLAVLALHYCLFREMFTREQVGRGIEFALLAAVAMMIPWRGRGRIGGFAVAATLWVATFSFYPSTPTATVVPLGRAQAMVKQLRLAFVAAPPNTARQATLVKRVDALPAPVLAAVRGRCVTVEPTEIAVVWAYQLRWCPLPALQSYNAYTPRLDHLDADAYANARNGPESVLRRVEAVDGRNPTWESPAAMLSLLCHFHEVARGGGWQALERVHDRCGPLEPFTILHARLGETLMLPPAPPGEVLVAAIDGLGVSFTEHLTSLVARVARRYVLIDGRRYRVPPDTASDGLLIGVPQNVDYVAPFNLDMHPHTISALISGHDGGAVTIRLLAATIRP